ncbi:MAG: BON domain-containing protein [Gemmatimonadales bacterium]|jgi:osmotically-inducible protein OsmY
MVSNNLQLASTVRARIINALGAHSPVDEALLAVDVRGARAVLRGCVHSWSQHQALERAALTTPGVTSVDNQLALLIKPRLSDPRWSASRVVDARDSS